MVREVPSLPSSLYSIALPHLPDVSCDKLFSNRHFRPSFTASSEIASMTMRSKSSMRGGAVILAASARGTCGVWPQANVCTIDHLLAAKRFSVVLDLVHTMHCDAQRQEQLQCRSACQPTTGGGGWLCRRICAAWPGEAVHVGVCEHADYSGAVRARQGETRVTQSPDPARTHLLDMASLTRERLFYNSLRNRTTPRFLRSSGSP